MSKFITGFALLAGLLLYSCNESTLVGTEILEGDFVDVGFTDTSTLKAFNVLTDSARIYPATNTLFLLGAVNDPVFGKTSTEIYRQIRKIFDIPDLDGAVLDSVVVSIGLNPSGLWGDTLVRHTVEIYELGESLTGYDSIYTHQQFSKGMLLGTKTFNPFLQDTATLVLDGDTLTYNNLLRIRLDQAWGEKLLADTLALANDTLIQELTNGLVIRSTPEGNSFFGIDNTIYLDDITNKIILYCNQGDTLYTRCILTLGGKAGLYIEHDRSQSMVKDYLNNPEGSDTLLFLSGLRNTGFRMELPYLDGLEDLLINYAELEFYTAVPEGLLPHEKVQQIHTLNIDTDGSKSYITDLNYSILKNLISYYDGVIEEVESDEGTMLYRYRINFTNELKRRIEEQDTETQLLFLPSLSTDRAYRSVLYGPGHEKYPARLKITYTNR